MEIYVVRQGDTVDTIAAAYGVDAGTIIYINQLVSPYPLVPGQALLITGGEVPAERRTIRSGGYAYPFIQEYVLEATLPFLTELYIFSYGFTWEGDLIPPQLSEDFMLEKAAGIGVDTILTLTPLGADGRFNNQLIHQMVTTPEVEARLIEQLLQKVEEKGYAGVDVDFEYILAEDRDYFTDFARRLTERMNENGYRVSVALAPKTSAEQQGLLYQGKDYGALGSVANQVLLMTYEWGYTYGPPMAVAPINKVREVVDYAITEIPVSKINLGIPNYGYDWPLPYERGVTKARTIGNVEAVQIAARQGAEIHFDETAASPYFRYTEGSVEHEVWFEDVRSIQAKFELIREYQLSGAVYWQLMRLFLANWYLLNSEFIIER